MAEKTKKKVNKLAIAVITLSVALIAAIGGIFGVYAALQQNVSTTFSVQYSIGKNVAVAIGASTQDMDELQLSWFEADTSLTKRENNLYEIGVNSNDQNLNLRLPESANGVLSLTNQYAIRCIYFHFENLSSSSLKLSVTDNSVIVGDIDVYYQYQEKTDVSSSMASGFVSLDDSFTIQPGKVGCFCVSIMLKSGADPNKSASYTSGSNGGLSFKIEQA